MPKRTWVQDAKTGKLREVTKERVSRHNLAIHSFSPVISPVTGEHIRSATQLREHEKRTGMTNDLDSLREQAQRESTRKHKTGTRQDRLNGLLDSWERAESSGYSRRVEYED